MILFLSYTHSFNCIVLKTVRVVDGSKYREFRIRKHLFSKTNMFRQHLSKHGNDNRVSTTEIPTNSNNNRDIFRSKSFDDATHVLM